MAGAKAAYQQAIDSGARRRGADGRSQPGAPAQGAGGRGGAQGRLPAGHRLRPRRCGAGGRRSTWGRCSRSRGTWQGAKAAYQQAIDSGHAEQAPRAAFNLGMLLKEQGDVAGREGRLPAGHRLRPRRRGARAAVNLGMLLRSRGTCRARRPPTSRPSTPATPTGRRGPRSTWGCCWRSRGMWRGAKAAYQQAIDSGHADAAPRAAVNLGMLLAEQGDVRGREGRLPAGHRLRPRRAAPRAAVNLGCCSRSRGTWRGEGGLPASHRLRPRRRGAKGRPATSGG